MKIVNYFQKKVVECSIKILGFFPCKKSFLPTGFFNLVIQKNPGSTSFDTSRLRFMNFRK